MSDDNFMPEESSNRTFLYAAGGLAALLLIGIIAIVTIALTGSNDENARIAAANLTTAYENSLVTQTVAAMTVEASQPEPTNTPVPPTFTPTNIPTFTPVPPTHTPTTVAQVSTPETPEGETEAAPVATQTPEPAQSPEPTPTLGPGGGQLPPGGLGMAGAVTAAVVLIGVIVIVRRLRLAV